jgi:hypothetical protein
MLKDILHHRSQIHTRSICLTTYPHTDSQVLVHGELKDQRYIRVFDVSGKTSPPGIVHHMSVTLLVDPDPLTIIQAEAEMIVVPMAECSATLDRIDPLIGIEIKSGFSSRIRKIMGGNRGCTHLCTLVVAMGQEIVHGWLTRKRSQKYPSPVSLEAMEEKGYLIDSCRMWKKGGPKMREMLQDNPLK